MSDLILILRKWVLCGGEMGQLLHNDIAQFAPTCACVVMWFVWTGGLWDQGPLSHFPVDPTKFLGHCRCHSMQVKHEEWAVRNAASDVPWTNTPRRFGRILSSLCSTGIRDGPYMRFTVLVFKLIRISSLRISKIRRYIIPLGQKEDVPVRSTNDWTQGFVFCMLYIVSSSTDNYKQYKSVY